MRGAREIDPSASLRTDSEEAYAKSVSGFGSRVSDSTRDLKLGTRYCVSVDSSRTRPLKRKLEMKRFRKLAQFLLLPAPLAVWVTGCALEMADSNTNPGLVEVQTPNAPTISPEDAIRQQEQEVAKNNALLERQHQEIHLLKRRLGEY